MPMFNAQATVARAIESCLNQSHAELELLIVDDASSDNSRDVVRNIDDRRVKLIALDENRGPGGARNCALDAANGAWLTVLDADDAYRPTRVERLLAASTSFDDGSAVVVDRSDVVDSGGNQLGRWRKAHPARDTIVLSPLEAVKGGVSGKPFFSRRLLDRSRARYPTHVRFGEDTAFLIQLLNTPGSKLVKVPDALYVYTHRPDSLTRATDRLEHLAESYRFLLDDCSLDDDLAAQVKRMRAELDMAQKWESARSAVRAGDYGRFVLEMVKSPSLSLRAARAYGRHRRYRTARRAAGAPEPPDGSSGAES